MTTTFRSAVAYLAPYPNPASRARMTACTLSATCSFRKLYVTWLRTGLMLTGARPGVAVQVFFVVYEQRGVRIEDPL